MTARTVSAAVVVAWLRSAAAQTEPAADAVERIDLGEPAATVAAPPPAVAPPERHQMLGWARSLATIQIPDESVVSRSQLFLEGRYARAGRLELRVSGLLGLTVTDTTSRLDPELREATVALFLDGVDVRIGQQRLPWGQSDIFRPNDVLNPRDLRDPVLAETSLLRLPVPMLRVDVSLVPELELQLVFEPYFVPDRLDLDGGGWALIQPDAPLPYRAQLAFSRASADPAVRSFAAELAEDLGQRTPRIEEAGGGARMGAHLDGVDLGLSYFYGHAGLQSIEPDPALVQALFTTDFANLTQGQFDAGFHAMPPPPVPVRAYRNHHAGLDAVTTAGSMAFRLDAAFDSQRVVYDRMLAPARTPAVEVVGGVELQTGDLDRSVIVEVDYTRLLDAPDRPLLQAARDSVAVATRARWTWDWLQAELTGIAGVHPLSYVVRPELGWKSGASSIRVGAVLLGGESWSVGDYFQANRCAYLLARQIF